MKRVLFVTYYYPPSGGPGVQRSLKFTKYLQDFGWRPTVLTVRPDCASYPDLDPDLGAEIPDTIDVERTSAWDPYAFYARILQKEKQDVITISFLGEAELDARQRLARWVRANIFLPDARVGWVPFAAARGYRLLREQPFDAVVTTGPPHSAHLIGLILRLIHKKPWLVDLRDPWSGIDYAADLPTSSLARSIDLWMERTVLANASAAVVVSEQRGRRLLEIEPVPLYLIENGFDPADFEDARGHPPEDKFVLSHIGNLNQARNPTAVWKAVRALRDEGRLEHFRVSFTGNVEPAVLQSAAQLGLSDLVEVLPYVPHEKAVEHMRSSTMLLLCINRVEGADGVIPGKLYEYVASGRPLLGMGPPSGDAARVLGESNAGRMLDFDDVDGTKAYLRASYAAWESGRPLAGAGAEVAARYSRRERTRALAAALDTISASPVSSSPTRETV